MPTARRTRTIAAPAEQVWEVVRDPHHLPRWWPRVTRVEGVEDGAFTEVMRTRKGKVVRADFSVMRCDEAAHSMTWSQRVQGTPFERVLESAETEVRLEPVVPSAPPSVGRDPGESTAVTIELRQEMARYSPRFGLFTGLSPRFGGHMVKRAAAATLEEALDGLERISG
jgi:uncharacterized protein YndB with AHSA1/START domain